MDTTPPPDHDAWMRAVEFGRRSMREAVESRRTAGRNAQTPARGARMRIRLMWGDDGTGVETDVAAELAEEGFRAVMEGAWAKYSRDVLGREPDWYKLRSMAEHALYANSDAAEREYERLRHAGPSR